MFPGPKVPRFYISALPELYVPQILCFPGSYVLLIYDKQSYVPRVQSSQILHQCSPRIICSQCPVFPKVLPFPRFIWQRVLCSQGPKFPSSTLLLSQNYMSLTSCVSQSPMFSRFIRQGVLCSHNPKFPSSTQGYMFSGSYVPQLNIAHDGNKSTNSLK